MARGFVLIAAADFLLKMVHFRGKELDGTAALRANHVMVAAAVVLMLVAGDAIVKSDFAGQATLGQKLERPVNRRKPDALVLLLDQAVQFLYGKMLAGFEKCLQN